MKKIIFGLLALGTISAYADNSITLKMTDSTGFGVDTHTIPSKDGESAEQSFLLLVNASPQDACYTGKVSGVKKELDALAKSAKNVKNFSSIILRKNLSVGLTVYNENTRSNQDNQLLIEKCK